MNSQESISDYQFFLFSKVYELEGFDCRKTFQELFDEISILYNEYCKWYGKSNYNISDYYTMQYYIRNRNFK